MRLVFALEMILYAALIIASILFSVIHTTAFASNEITTRPPPPGELTAVTEKDVYLLGETIKITGIVREPQPGRSVMIQIHDPHNKIYLSAEVPVLPNGTYSFEQDIEGKVVTGMYLGELSYASFNSNVRFMVIAGPFDLKVGNITYPIEYRLTSGLIRNITVGQAENALTIQIVNSSQGGELTIKLPRTVIDARASDITNDADFTVMINNRPTDLELADFVEIGHDDDFRTMVVKVPYNGPLYDEWYIKVIGTRIIPEFGSILAMLLMVVFIGIVSLSRTRSGVSNHAS